MHPQSTVGIAEAIECNACKHIVDWIQQNNMRVCLSDAKQHPVEEREALCKHSLVPTTAYKGIIWKRQNYIDCGQTQPLLNQCVIQYFVTWFQYSSVQ